MAELKWGELFPTKWSFIVFILYMGLFINQGILVTASQNGKKGYSYNTVTAVLLTEVIKLLVSSGLFMHRHVYVPNRGKKRWSLKFLLFLVRQSVGTFIGEVRQNSRVFLLYFIPAILYCLYNNLAYTNLVTFDPTTYFLLLQFRVVVTGIVFQILFKKKLSKHQWVSLIFLTVGCMIKEVDFNMLFATSTNVKVEAGGLPLPQPTSTQPGVFELSAGIFLIFLQVVCSSGAGVYNEFLLKNTGAHVPVLVQNTCLYIDSIICNLAVLLLQGNISSALNWESLKLITGTPIILAVVINNAAIGIVTSFFLAQLNSILKTFASALELMFTAVLCWMIFGIPIYMNTVLAIAVVTFAIYLYSLQPVVNRSKMNMESGASPSLKGLKDAEEMQKILDEECV